MSNKLDYPEIILPRLRYQFCPMCCESLSRKVMADDGIARVVCSSCGWIHYPTQAQGVNVIIWKELDSSMEGIVALLPSDAPKEAPAALPSGHVEYGESPEEAAIREAREETGLEVEVIRNLGWYYGRPLAYPGPMISFVYETRAIGGTLKESDEGAVEVFPLNLFPQISPNRTGSQQAMQLLHNSRLKCLSI